MSTLRYRILPDGSYAPDRTPVGSGAVTPGSFADRRSADPPRPGTWRLGRLALPEVEVSTVFLFYDRNHTGRGGPVLWETAVTRPYVERYHQHYRSEREAWAGYWAGVAVHLRALALPPEAHAVLERLAAQCLPPGVPDGTDWVVFADMLTDAGRDDAAAQVRTNWAHGPPA